MLMWDEPYETNNHKIFIAFDSDQSLTFSGFKLDWTTEILKFDLTNVYDALIYIKNQMMWIVNKTEFTDDRGTVILRRRVKGYFRSIDLVLLLERQCAIGVETFVPCKLSIL
jgi:hypothetical protein